MILNVLWSLSPLILILVGFFVILKLRTKGYMVKESEDSLLNDGDSKEDMLYPGSTENLIHRQNFRENDE